MVTDTLKRLTSSEGESAQEATRTIKGLSIINLKKIDDESDIRKVCSLVMDAVDRLLLVQIDESKIKNRKVKKHRDQPIEYTNDEMWQQSAQIRGDWSSEKWLMNPPKGWVYHENDSVLGVIYQAHNSKGENTIFINREVADNPIGAMLLIKIMKERLEKIAK